MCSFNFGAEKSQAREQVLSAPSRLESAIQVVSLGEFAGQHDGQIRADLQRKAQPIRSNDLWIAAHARAERWIVVNSSTRAFARVEGLQVENWAEG